MVEKIKSGTKKALDWIKGAQTWLSAVALVFAAGVAWSQVATKSEMDKCKADLRSEFERSLDKRNKEIIDRLDPMRGDMSYARDRIDGVKTQVDKIDGRTEVLMKVLRK